MNWLRALFERKQSRSRVTTLDKPFIIRAPRLRFLNLIGPSAESFLAADRAVLSPLFPHNRVLDTVEPCDVLLLYCKVEDDGRFLKRIVEASQAPIVVVASENGGDAYVKASASGPPKYTNLVLTIDRHGASFETFFRALFGMMWEGTTMPMAWVQLSPQGPGGGRVDAPDTIFACGAGHLRFEM